MEHDTNAAPNRPAHGDPDDANLEAYGDWVTVDPDPAASAESSPAADEADAGGAHQESDSRAAQDLTEAEEELLDQLTDSERVAGAAPAAATAAPAAADPHATTAALAKLERQLSSLDADLKAVGQQLAELRGRVGEVPEPAAVPADVDPPPADVDPPPADVDPPPAEVDPPPAQSFEAEAGDDPLAISLEELENDPPAPWEAAAPAPQAPPGEVAKVALEPPASAPPPAGQETPAEEEEVDSIELVAEPEPEPPAAISVETLPAEDPPPAAMAPAPGAEIGGPVREDVRSVLAYLDQLLDALPPEKVREFAQSEHFATYKKLFKEFDLDE